MTSNGRCIIDSTTFSSPAGATSATFTPAQTYNIQHLPTTTMSTPSANITPGGNSDHHPGLPFTQNVGTNPSTFVSPGAKGLPAPQWSYVVTNGTAASNGRVVHTSISTKSVETLVN